MKYLIFVLVLFGFVAAAQAGGNRCFNNAGYPAYGNNSSCGNASGFRPGTSLLQQGYGNIPSYGTLNNCNCTETYLPSSHIINSNCDSE